MKYYLIEDTCVMCGTPVPEGTWVCPNCKKKVEEEPEKERSKESGKESLSLASQKQEHRHRDGLLQKIHNAINHSGKGS